jgi:hypothetical protein
LHSYQLFYTSPTRSVSLRELYGHAELAADDSGTRAALNLLNKLIVRESEDGPPLMAEKIAVADRDFLLSRIYKSTYGPKIESTMNCNACSSKFDLSFFLDDLMSHESLAAFPTDQDSEGYYLLNEKLKFRLPNGEDEIAVCGLPIKEAEASIIRRCIPEQISNEERNEIQELMEQAAPFLFMDLAAICPECGHQQSMLFDMQSFLLAKIRQEKKRLAFEVHCIASTYHWSQQEILNIPRTLRKTYCSFASQHS